MDKVILSHGLLGLRQHGGRPGHIPWVSFRRARNTSLTINLSILRSNCCANCKALLTMLFGGIQIVPLVVDAGQTKMGFAGNTPWVASPSSLQELLDRSLLPR